MMLYSHLPGLGVADGALEKLMAARLDPAPRLQRVVLHAIHLLLLQVDDLL